MVGESSNDARDSFHQRYLDTRSSSYSIHPLSRVAIPRQTTSVTYPLLEDRASGGASHGYSTREPTITRHF
jgi:hypothetical protein